MSTQNKPLKKIKSGFLERGLTLAKLSLQSGAQLAAGKIENFIQQSSEDEKSKKWADFLKNQSVIFSTEIGKLKGSIMKAGQMVSMYGEYFLPPEANEALRKLYSQSPPLHWSEMSKVLEAQLPAEKIALLDIDPTPIGSASLGQVHKAKVKSTNEWIALKIQYPGVDKAIDSDLKAIKSFLSMTKVIPQGYDLQPLFSEVKDMMVQEMNYRIEAERTKEYRLKLKDDSRFIVPKIYDEFCSDRVIATSYESGLTPDNQAIQNLSQERRNNLASAFLELYMREFYDWGFVQTDPHPGNYKIRLHPDGNDQIILLDFGAVKKYEDSFLKSYKKMITHSLLNEDSGIHDSIIELKFINEKTSAKIKDSFIEFCKLTVEPFRGGVYDFKQSNLPQRLTDKIYQLVRSFELNSPPKEVLFLDRKTGGVFIFLVVLGAKFDPKPILQKYIEVNY